MKMSDIPFLSHLPHVQVSLMCLSRNILHKTLLLVHKESGDMKLQCYQQTWKYFILQNEPMKNQYQQT